eukprot:TRINITY_DN66159_c0_g1_i1.p2 TRINITY_DN66159_c0_g1~~TRINITY_DN66159_c0_g1_i1.p2  ORF type:complete len:234 (+),score=79.10 TRINITY_DN66159_c0_g1_i1:89-703(+)
MGGAEPAVSELDFRTNHGNLARLRYDHRTGCAEYTLNGLKRAAPRRLLFSPRSRRLDYPGTANWHVTLPKGDASALLEKLRGWAQSAGVPFETTEEGSQRVCEQPEAAGATLCAAPGEVRFRSAAANAVCIAKGKNGLCYSVNGERRAAPRSLAYAPASALLSFPGTRNWPCGLPAAEAPAIAAALQRLAAECGVPFATAEGAN